jgi:hypothetical protein
MAQDPHRQAKERYEDAVDAMRENQQRMQEDLEFSNPSDPKQWPEEALKLRKGRPCYTFDRTNQFISQVVNDARQNKPSIQVIAVDSGADKHTAQVIGGIIKHIEYTSRADQAYDTALEHAARTGLGWLRVVPEVIRPETNEQEILIKRVHDPMSVFLEAGWTEADGSDANHGFVATKLPIERFKRMYPKAKHSSWEDENGVWIRDDSLTICEYFCLKDEMRDYLQIELPTGEVVTKEAGEYNAYEMSLGYRPRVLRQYQAAKRRQLWYKMTGAEILEETEFPSQWVPLIPVIGDEVWIENKRYLCGMVRKLMPGQRAYNMERSAAIEFVALQPKAPFMVPFEGVEGHEQHWERLNSGSPAYLPYNHVDEQGNDIPMPKRVNPPPMPAAFAALGQIASQDMEAGVGMFKANLGVQGNETSGRAIQARKMEGDTATFHYADNMTRSISHLGRIVVDMLPRIFDEKRVARIMGDDGRPDFVTIAPGSGKAQREGKRTTQIDLTAGQYDVRVTAGAAHITQRQQTADALTMVLQAAPQFAAVLAPALMKVQDWPDADKYANALLAMAPPEVKAIIDGEEEDEQIPPQVQAQLQQMQQQMEQMAAMLDAAEKELERLESTDKANDINAQKVQIDAELRALELQLTNRKIDIDEYNAQTQRLKLAADQQSKDMDRELSAQQAADDKASEQVEGDKPEPEDMAEEKGTAQAVVEAISPVQEELKARIEQMTELQAQAQQTLDAILKATQAPRVKQAKAVKQKDGTWALESVEQLQ